MNGPSCIRQFLINYRAYTMMATNWCVPNFGEKYLIFTVNIWWTLELLYETYSLHTLAFVFYR